MATNRKNIHDTSNKKEERGNKGKHFEEMAHHRGGEQQLKNAQGY